MKHLSTVTDALALGGFGLVGFGLYEVKHFLLPIFLGVLLIAAARSITKSTPTDKEGNQ